MYTCHSTLITKPVPVLREVVITQPSIQFLDICKNNFYEAFRISDNTPLIIYPTQVKPADDRPFLECRLLERAAVSVFKSSVVFLSTDKRGLQLNCQAPNKQITLFIQWKEVGILKPDENHFDLFLGYLRQGILKYHLKTIVTQPNNIRKAIFKTIGGINIDLRERYHIGNNLWLETGSQGWFNIVKRNKIQARSICLEQITTKICTL